MILKNDWFCFLGEMTVTLDSWQKRMEGFAKASAELIITMNTVIPKYPLEFKHGMTWQEVQRMHKILVSQHRFKKEFVEYENRLRDCYNRDKTAGKHYVHGRIHYFPLYLDEDGLIDHSRCEKCSQK